MKVGFIIFETSSRAFGQSRQRRFRLHTSPTVEHRRFWLLLLRFPDYDAVSDRQRGLEHQRPAADRERQRRVHPPSALRNMGEQSKATSGPTTTAATEIDGGERTSDTICTSPLLRESGPRPRPPHCSIPRKKKADGRRVGTTAVEERHPSIEVYLNAVN